MAKGYQRQTMEMSFVSIRGEGPWTRDTTGSERIVTVSLIWPRPLVASRVAVQTHAFSAKGCELQDMDWSESILFKEAVEGPFGVVVQVSDSLSAQQLARVAASIGEVALKAAGSEVASIAVGPGLRAMARFPFNYLADALSDVGKTAPVVAAGRVTLLPGKSTDMTIPLLVPEDIVKLRRRKHAGRVQRIRETLHRQGDPAGEASLTITYYQK